jgi:hypothetical protein
MSNTTFLQEPEPLDREQSIEAYLKPRLQSLDRAVAGYTSVSLQALTGNVDLTPTQAKHRVIKLTGVPTGAVSLRIPHATGANADIIFVNACTGTFSTVTVKSMGANAGNSLGVPLATGKTRHVRHDGESVYPAAPEQTTVGTPYAARVYNAADISIANATATALTFNSERRDDGALHSTSSNTDRLTASVSGWYVVWGNVEFVSNAVGFRTLSFRVNATPDIYGAEQQAAVSGSETIMSSATLIYLTAGDYVRMFVYQNSGGALSVRYTGGVTASFKYSPEFGMILLVEV